MWKFKKLIQNTAPQIGTWQHEDYMRLHNVPRHLNRTTWLYALLIVETCSNSLWKQLAFKLTDGYKHSSFHAAFSLVMTLEEIQVNIPNCPSFLTGREPQFHHPISSWNHPVSLYNTLMQKEVSPGIKKKEVSYVTDWNDSWNGLTNEKKEKNTVHLLNFLWNCNLSFHVSQFLLSKTGIFITLYLRGVHWKCIQVSASEALKKAWHTVLSTAVKSVRKLIIPASVHDLIIWIK